MESTNTTTLQTAGVIVLGSINADHFIYVDSFPQPGETVLAQAGTMGLGGKGANQAVAAALLGAEVHLLGRCGEDSAAEFIRDRLEHFGVPSRHLVASSAEPTGAAYITVESEGENTVAVVSGANAEVDLDMLRAQVEGIVHGPVGSAGPITVALAQGETPPQMTAAFAERCNAAGVRFVLNLAPAVPIEAHVLRWADPLILNEGEARTLLERFQARDVSLDSVDDAMRSASRLIEMDAAVSVIITLGPDGAVVASEDGVWHQESPVPPEVVETTGAGDAFVGAVVAVLSGGASLSEAVRWAVVAGSAAVSRKGTTDSYPSTGELIDAYRLTEESALS